MEIKESIWSSKCLFSDMLTCCYATWRYHRCLVSSFSFLPLPLSGSSFWSRSMAYRLLSIMHRTIGMS
ncbi:hypothetical protein DVUA0140 (plasmid) [Nitratidesulfovibrio vulgaris str. Hildenborough]|uniref:Uncharacterized protein n=1 Tax=Nitratidesulfovibrio vulgaris (strain ATCC 29579 / DSM 644 / CCUG 34227 / NCIMB 8303 / VKM B-1760 / Hildenborough) TaxID=882 RepID=Q72WE9_NITV2|nr:hypothetical protein DVUA0140 [Nitratidesulfovibrio vulgaris str. Hildenborough]